MYSTSWVPPLDGQKKSVTENLHLYNSPPQQGRVDGCPLSDNGKVKYIKIDESDESLGRCIFAMHPLNADKSPNNNITLGIWAYNPNNIITGHNKQTNQFAQASGLSRIPLVFYDPITRSPTLTYTLGPSCHLFIPTEEECSIIDTEIVQRPNNLPQVAPPPVEKPKEEYGYVNIVTPTIEADAVVMPTSNMLTESNDATPEYVYVAPTDLPPVADITAIQITDEELNNIASQAGNCAIGLGALVILTSVVFAYLAHRFENPRRPRKQNSALTGNVDGHLGRPSLGELIRGVSGFGLKLGKAAIEDIIRFISNNTKWNIRKTNDKK